MFDRAEVNFVKYGRSEGCVGGYGVSLRSSGRSLFFYRPFLTLRVTLANHTRYFTCKLFDGRVFAGLLIRVIVQSPLNSRRSAASGGEFEARGRHWRANEMILGLLMSSRLLSRAPSLEYVAATLLRLCIAAPDCPSKGVGYYGPRYCVPRLPGARFWIEDS